LGDSIGRTLSAHTSTVEYVQLNSRMLMTGINDICETV